MPKELTNYSGTYAIRNNLMDVKVNENGELTTAIIINGEVIDKSKKTYYHTYSGYFVSEDGKEAYRFKDEKNNETYIEIKQYNSNTGLAVVPICMYYGQKVKPITLTDEEKRVWEERSKKMYFMINEKYSSLSYTRGLQAINIGDNYKGYILGSRIEGINKLGAIANIPGQFGRDLLELDFYNDNKNEYLKLRSCVFIESSALLNINSKSNKIVIGEDGYAKWGIISPELNGKSVTIETPDEGGFTLYSNIGEYINDSYITKNKKVTLKTGEFIVFAGSCNSEFNIKFEE